jgi:hypothetical protein
MIIRWLHRRYGHTQTVTRVSVPGWDPFARGELIRCSCGEVWAR